MSKYGVVDPETAELSTDDVYAGLVEAILSRDLRPGMKLSEETIASSFGVNRMVVRAVLNRLHGEALVEIHKNRGAYVSSPTVEEAREIFDLRIVLEREVAARLARQITPAQLDELQGQVSDHRQSYRAGRDAESRRFAERFHQRAAAMVGNRVLEATLGKLITRSALVMALYGRSSSSECGIDEHDAILEMLRKRDAAAASDAMVHHLEHILARVSLDGEAVEEPGLGDILARYALRPARTK